MEFIKDWILPYIYELCSIVLAPLFGYRATNSIKHTYYKFTKLKCHWLILDTCNFIFTMIVSYLFWVKKYQDIKMALLVSVIVAVSQITIIKIIFAVADRFSSKLATEIKEGIDWEDEPKTVMAAAKTIMFGKKIKKVDFDITGGEHE